MEMAGSKTIDRICCLAVAVMLILTAVIWTGKASAGKQDTLTVGYEGLFDTGYVHTIDIEIADWDSLIAAATQETYTECSVTIDGEKITNVGIRAKGNTSLSSVASMGSKKYSFKIEFDQYVKGRTYHGLDKLSLNNLIYDATMMKDYLAYTLMGRSGVPAPLCSYVRITVNGEPWGLYLAVEGVEDGFMERNNMTTGELYKPDSMSFGGGRGNGRDFDFEQLLLMARLDETGGKIQCGALDLAALLREERQHFLSLTEQRQIQWQDHLPEHLNMWGDGRSVRQMLNLLMDNAAQYTCDGGTITCSGTGEKKRTILVLSNTVDKLPEQKPEELAERFVRGNTARTQKSGGAGIGLSAVKRIVEMHKGRMTIAYPDRHTFRVTIELPGANNR